MGCKGICVRYKFSRIGSVRQIYSNGGSRCQVCEIFVKWEGFTCPCCGYRLRKTPRSKKGKEIKKQLEDSRVDKNKNKKDNQSMLINTK